MDWLLRQEAKRNGRRMLDLCLSRDAVPLIVLGVKAGPPESGRLLIKPEQMSDDAAIEILEDALVALKKQATGPTNPVTGDRPA